MKISMKRALLLSMIMISIIYYAFGDKEKKLINVPESIHFENIYSGERILKQIDIENISNSVVVIKEVKTSCGCTTVDLPSKVIAPGKKVSLKIALSTSGKSGKISKSIRIYLEGQRRYYRTNISGEVKKMPKAKHIAISGSIFEGKCVECHVTPAIGKMGQELYLGVCASCHGIFMEGHSAPQLANISAKKSDLFSFIAHGKNQTMPAFSDQSKGPLNNKQIKSLVDFITQSEIIKKKQSAKGLYKQYCSACHGLKREGGVGPELTIKSMELMGREKITKTLITGIPNTLMKPFHKDKGGTLESSEIKMLIEFLLYKPTIRK
jgi:mono/diheme cytochrome c family protein